MAGELRLIVHFPGEISYAVSRSPLNFTGTLSPVPDLCPELFSPLYPLYSPCKDQSLGQHVYRFRPDRPKNRDGHHNPRICLSLRAPEGCVAISMYKGEVASLRSQ